MSGYARGLSGILAAGVLLVLVNAGALFAQGVTGTVSGTIRDAQGGVIPGATVTIISESRNTVSAPVFTNDQGGFVFPNVAADTYTIQIEMPSFRTLRRTGVAVSPGSIVALGAMTIEVGGQQEVVTVTAETPLVQTASGERSFTVTTESVSNLPLQGRTFEQLLALAPGVVVTPGELNPATRAGGGGGANYMLDGATAMDPGINRPAARVSVEALDQVKLVTSSYQAEYARSAGLQINAVTKSGTNQFRGSLYNAVRNSNWNANRKTNILNGDAKPTLPANQNPAAAVSATSTDPATSYVSTNPDLVRYYRGFANINQQQPIGWRTYHSVQISVNRRFRNGLLFGFNDTISLSDKQNAALRLQHNADGTITTRADQALADELLGNNNPQRHIMRAQFVWNLPRLEGGGARRALGVILND